MTLHLSVQYASVAAAPGRAQVRRWVQAAMATLRAAPRRDRAFADAAFTIRFVDEPEGRTLNHRFRGKDHATNVLTFPDDDQPADTVAADIVVCMPVVAIEAQAQHKDVMDHCGHLVVHGTLHACGLDHESTVEAEAMESLERVVLARFGIDDPYRVTDADAVTVDPAWQRTASP